jgi:hypothetical protein
LFEKFLDLENEPSLKPIHYFVQSSIFKQHFYSFIHHHYIGILSFALINIGITCAIFGLSSHFK